MTDRFDPAVADSRWQQRWAEAQSFRADSNSPKPKSYVLEMFPYPSGRIHMGHVRNYTMGDVLARFRRMQGFEVLHPMGWDAFGMPAENAAMEKKVHPGAWTRENIAAMRRQLQRIGFALDWSRELATCEPDYYGHEQALFLDLMDAGLVTRKESEVNWDPVDMTVLGERAGDRRARLAVGSTGRTQEAVPVVPQDHRFRRRATGRSRLTRRLARQGPADAGKLDRQEPGASVLLPIWPPACPAEPATSRSSPPAPTPSSAQASSPFRRVTRLLRAGRRPARSRGVHRQGPCRWNQRGGNRNRREAGIRYRPGGCSPVRRELAASGVDRQFRAHGIWHRRALRRARP